MKQFTTEILSQSFLCEGYYRLVFQWDQRLPAPLPGQFFNLRISAQSDPLLRRPFAFAGFDSQRSRASMIYQVRGEGTRLLSRKTACEQLDIAGPFGNSFTPPADAQKVYILAGGIGIGPMLYLDHWLQKANYPVVFVYGCRTAALVPRCHELEELNAVICTDDGSRGFKGTCIDYLESLEKQKTAGSWLAACGPLPMLKGSHQFASARDAVCQVSMEEIMACAVGACAGCVIKTTAPSGYSKVCSEGAIFNSKDIIWD